MVVVVVENVRVSDERVSLMELVAAGLGLSAIFGWEVVFVTACQHSSGETMATSPLKPEAQFGSLYRP